jgi:transcriptional regulator with XRE-family HTH domain
MTPEQSKMARAGLGWSLTRLATEAHIGRATAARFELGEAVQDETVDAIRKAFTNAGVDLIQAGQQSKTGGAGVRFQAE